MRSIRSQYMTASTTVATTVRDVPTLLATGPLGAWHKRTHAAYVGPFRPVRPMAGPPGAAIWSNGDFARWKRCSARTNRPCYGPLAARSRWPRLLSSSSCSARQPFRPASCGPPRRAAANWLARHDESLVGGESSSFGNGRLNGSPHRSVATTYALECLAWCLALPRLAVGLDQRVWWELLNRLLIVADGKAPVVEHTTFSLDPLTQQMLLGELPLALSHSFPELAACHEAAAFGLRDRGRRNGRFARRRGLDSSRMPARVATAVGLLDAGRGNGSRTRCQGMGTRPPPSLREVLAAYATTLA